MSLLAFRSCLVVAVVFFRLASTLPTRQEPTGLSGRIKSNFYYVGKSSENGNDNSSFDDNVAQDLPLDSGGESHVRVRRSTVEEFHFVSQPRVPRFTYIRSPQRLPEPEPEPEPEPIPEPVVEERQHVLEEESHKHESEEHEEEHESHMTEEELLEEELMRAMDEREATPRALEEPAVARSDDDRHTGKEIIEKTVKESRRVSKKSSKKTIISGSKPHKTKSPKKPKKQYDVPLSGVGAPAVVNAQPQIVEPQRVIMNPPPPHVFYDNFGLVHMSLETSPTERLDLVQTGVDRYGGVVWGVSVDDRRGNCLAYVHLGPGFGNLNFQPINGRRNHVDWVMSARDDFGVLHDIHLKNSRGHLQLVNGLYYGQPSSGVLGYDDGGEILIPVHYHHGHIVIEDIVHSNGFIIY